MTYPKKTRFTILKYSSQIVTDGNSRKGGATTKDPKNKRIVMTELSEIMPKRHLLVLLVLDEK